MRGNALSMERKFFLSRSRPASCNGRQLWQSEFAWHPQSSKYRTHQLSAKIHIGNNWNNCNTNIPRYSPRILLYQRLTEKSPRASRWTSPTTMLRQTNLFWTSTSPSTRATGTRVSCCWQSELKTSYYQSSGFKLSTSGLMDLVKDWDRKPKPLSL